MELPDDIIAIIREYSKPCTRPDWKKDSYIKRNEPSEYYFQHSVQYEFTEKHYNPIDTGALREEYIWTEWFVAKNGTDFDYDNEAWYDQFKLFMLPYIFP